MVANRILTILTLFSILILCGCASSSEKKAEKDDAKAFIHTYEKTFEPSDYDQSPSEEKNPERKSPKPPGETGTASTESELVPGFRVQLNFTDNVEQANSIRDEVSSVVADQSVYVVFETPYYKIRVGDFQSKPEANLTLKVLVDKGYKDAWIVPDKVKKLQ